MVVLSDENQIMMAGFVINAKRRANTDKTKTNTTDQLTMIFLEPSNVLKPTHMCKAPVYLFPKESKAKMTHPSEDVGARCASFCLVVL